MTRRKLVAGNWKMNGATASLAEIDAVVAGLAERSATAVDVALCPPAIMIVAAAARAAASPLAIGGQDCHAAASGAHTGDVAAEMLADAGAASVIVGHSERRTDHGETDAVVMAKAEAALRARLQAIVCVGETEAERDAGQALAVVDRQIRGSTPSGATAANLVIAYEPVWAIGTGRTPTAPEIAEIHAAARETLRAAIGASADETRILYGGSVKPGNAAEIFALDGVDGALVGGASLKATDFLAIVDAAIGA